MQEFGATENPGGSVSPDPDSMTDNTETKEARVGLQVSGESVTSDQSAGDGVLAG